MPGIDDLFLHEQLLLLALHDEKGTMQTVNFSYGAGGAVLAELSLTGRIRSEPAGRKHLVRVLDTSQPGDPVLDETLHRIRTSKRAEQPATWARRVAGTKRLRHRIADRLRLRGILAKKEGRVLLVFSRDLYPTANPAPERELVARMRAAVLDSETPAPRTAILVALAQHIGLTHCVLDRAERKAGRKRLKELAALEGLDESTRAIIKCVHDVIEENNAAAVIVTTG